MTAGRARATWIAGAMFALTWSSHATAEGPARGVERHDPESHPPLSRDIADRVWGMSLLVEAGVRQREKTALEVALRRDGFTGNASARPMAGIAIEWFFYRLRVGFEALGGSTTVVHTTSGEALCLRGGEAGPYAGLDLLRVEGFTAFAVVGGVFGGVHFDAGARRLPQFAEPARLEGSAARVTSEARGLAIELGTEHFVPIVRDSRGDHLSLLLGMRLGRVLHLGGGWRVVDHDGRAIADLHGPDVSAEGWRFRLNAGVSLYVF